MASANVATRSYADLLASWVLASSEQSRASDDRLVPLTRALFAEPNPSVIKATLAAQGRIASPFVRLPLMPASETATAVALKRLDDLAAP